MAEDRDVLFPAQEGVERPAASRSADWQLEMPGRILVVEDDTTIRLMLQRAFGRHAKVLTADNGRDGLAIIEREEPDFVLSDLSLPVMDGLAMITAARRSFTGACVPIMVLTANGEDAVLFECFRQGADDFMAKPFSINELRLRVSSIYMRQRMARDMNPLTRLPGNMVIKREITRRLEGKDVFSVAYIDLDHFKAFNDSRGFDRGDEAIRLVADLLRSYARTLDPGEVFVGHVGGDDYVVLLPPSRLEEMAEFLFNGFTVGLRLFYSPEEIAVGTVEITNRAGVTERVPLLSISVGALSTERADIDDYRKVTQIAAEVKHMAKKMPGNSLFIDRRRT